MSTNLNSMSRQDAPYTVLILESDKTSLNRLTTIFEPDGYAINAATAAPQALAMASLMMPDLIIFGSSLPDKECTDVCRQIRIDPLLRDIPVICVTAHNDAVARLRVLEVGADEIFTEPINEQEARTRVRNIIQQDRPRKLAAQRLEYERAQNEMENALDAILEKWAFSQEMIGVEAMGHTRRVTDLTVAVAREMGIPDEDINVIRRGAILHDIGRTACDDDDLLGWDDLPQREKAAIRQHPLRAQEMLWSIPILRPALAIPMHHHERWDGSGYPNGLQGEAIPLAARIFATVDVWDELCSGDPSRQPWQPNQAQAYIRAQAGKWFDPKVVEAFIKVLAERPALTGPPLPRRSGKLEKADKKKLKLGSSFSLSRRGAWMHLTISAFLITVLPMLILVWLWQFDTTSGGVSAPFAAAVIVATLGIMTSGYILLGKYRFNIVRLRHYLHTLASGDIPMRVQLSQDSDDLIAMQHDMADIVRQAADRIHTIMEQQERLLHAERQRVMIESLASLCHHLGQPTTMVATQLYMMEQQAQTPEMREAVSECQKSFEAVQDILNRLQRVVIYRTEPYLGSENINEESAEDRMVKI
ncbi:MAG: response regulator [Lentisphaerae bacterium]|jgi:putative two-component system response regulator|nr:response regulator [Lentisphaerota bacterium]